MGAGGTRMRALLLAVAVVVAVVACGSDGGDDQADDAPGSTVAAASTDTADPDRGADDQGAADATVIEASTSSTLAGTTSSTTSSTTATTSTTAGSSSTATTATTTTSASSTTATTGTGPVVDGGSSFAFTSPTGNIACVMDVQVSCWIGEKAWTIDQPAGPDCATSDWGNAVDLGADGPSFPCYTDMIWNVFAPPLDYGSAVTVGEFRCDSARAGVTCRNGAGRGFTVARAGVDLF